MTDQAPKNDSDNTEQNSESEQQDQKPIVPPPPPRIRRCHSSGTVRETIKDYPSDA